MNNSDVEDLDIKDQELLLTQLTFTTHVAQTQQRSINQIALDSSFVLIYPHQLSSEQRVELVKFINTIEPELVILGGPKNPPPKV